MQGCHHGAAFGSQRATETEVFGPVAGMPPSLPCQSIGNQQPMRHRLPRSQQQTPAFGDSFIEDVCLVQSGTKFAYSASSAATAKQAYPANQYQQHGNAFDSGASPVAVQPHPQPYPTNSPTVHRQSNSPTITDSTTNDSCSDGFDVSSAHSDYPSSWHFQQHQY